MSAAHFLIRPIVSALCYGYTALVLVLFFSVADQALGHFGLLPASPTLLCLVTLCPFGVVLLIRHLVEPSVPGPVRTIARNASALGPLAIVALCAVSLSSLPGAYWHEGGKWIFLIPYGLCIVSLAALLGRYRMTQAILPLTTLASLAAIAGSIWYDTLHPGTFAPATNRAAGFPGNANFAALVAVMLCAGGLDFGNPKRSLERPSEFDSKGCRQIVRGSLTNILLLVTTFAVVCMTMSRSGALNFALLYSVYIFYRFARSTISWRQRLFEVALLLAAIALAVGFTVAFTRFSATAHTTSRLTRLLNNERVDDGSAGTRLQAINEGLNLINSAPILGHGTGFARTMSELPHNIYLQQWVNNGLPGLVSYTLFLVSAFLTFVRRGSRNGVALIAVATLGGIFSHNILDQRPFLILLGLLLGLSQGDRQARGSVLWLARHRTAATLPHVHGLASADPATAQ